MQRRQAGEKRAAGRGGRHLIDIRRPVIEIKDPGGGRDRIAETGETGDSKMQAKERDHGRSGRRATFTRMTAHKETRKVIAQKK